MKVVVTDHAYWRAAERFRGFDTILIEEEVKAALREGRVSSERGHLGLGLNSDPSCLYAWTPDRQRVYALRTNWYVFTVTTVLKPERLTG